MNPFESIKNNPSVDIVRLSHLEIPKIVVDYWHWKQYSWSVYRLPNGIKVMSDRQMGLLVGQSKVDVSNFVKSNGLEIIKVELPNKMQTHVYPLSVAAIYLQKLLNKGRLKLHRLKLSNDEWLSLITALCNPVRDKAVTPNPYFFTGDYRVTVAKALPIQFENNISLEVLVLRSGEYRIEHREGLKSISSNPGWLVQYSPSKAKVFSRLKLSTDTVECRIITDKEIRSMYALSLDDWLSVWEYFANKGNRKATALLKACAKENIDSRVSKLINENQHG